MKQDKDGYYNIDHDGVKYQWRYSGTPDEYGTLKFSADIKNGDLVINVTFIPDTDWHQTGTWLKPKEEYPLLTPGLLERVASWIDKQENGF